MTATAELIERTATGLHDCLIGIVESRVPDRGVRTLDIGCGTGAFLVRMHRAGYGELYGIDYDPPVSLDEIDIRQFDLNKDQSASLGQFDLVLCIEVIEHVENIGNLLDCIHAVLKPGGIALVTTPNLESLHARIRGLLSGEFPHFDGKSDPTHLMPILSASLEKMLARRSMKIDELLAYPADARESVMFSSKIRRLRNFTAGVLKDPVPGDNTIYVIRHG